ncbi:hypothetical protein GCM10010277_84560 [Streptomyces longisporoflavus]|uniref:hypothetical protein n=1 Tax=Streptomyces longisporoflavus TaxID=28044 RepID=UPI00167DBDD7|nr:hypothetical protein [Streptomyces longisporoflavus]GGV72095.1 hypothetical protein GCM10010277_84560 [Streptomyces longisporoflavus]
MTARPYPALSAYQQPGGKRRMRRSPAREPTSWGWLRWSPSAPDGAPRQLLEIGIVAPGCSLRARCARRWLTRRPPIRLHLDHGGSVTALTLITGLGALLAMSWAVGHGLPLPAGALAAILLPLLADHLPVRLDAWAGRYVRTVESANGLAYLQRLIARHAVIVRAARSRPGPGPDNAVRLGHRSLWEIAVIITAPDRDPDTTCRWLALESLLDHLARQADDSEHQRPRGALEGPAAAGDDWPLYRAPGHP